MYVGLYVKYPLLLSAFNTRFSRQTFEKKENSNFMKIRPVEAELFHVDGQIDMMKLIVAFRITANASKNGGKNPFVRILVLRYGEQSTAICWNGAVELTRNYY